MLRGQRLIYVLWVIIICGTSSYGQTPEVEWETLLGDTVNHDYGLGAFQTADGGYIVGGNSNAWNGGYYDNVMFKLNATGDTLWSASNLLSGSQENAVNFRLMPNGSYMFSGYSTQNPEGGTAYLFNADSDGSYGWTGLYGNETIQETATCSAPAGDTAYVLITNCWYSPEYANDIRMYYVGMTGWESWTQPYHSVVADGADCINSVPTGDYIVTGYTQTPDFTDYELLMLRIGMYGGIQVWNRIGGSHDDAGYWVIPTADGGFLATGYTKEIDGIGKDVYVVKTDCDCIPEWQKIYGFGYHDEGRYCAQTADGGYVIGATCRAYSTFDFWLLRLDADGDTLWTKVIERAGGQALYTIDITDDGGYLLCGISGLSGQDCDMYVVKLGSESAVDDNFTGLPDKTTLEQNYPNPFNQSTTIKFTLNEEEHVCLTVYDLLGREIMVLMNENKFAGGYSVNFDASGLPTGFYYYKLNTNSQSQARKMLYLK